MKLWTSARTVGALFLGFGLLMLAVTFAGVRFVGMFSPLSFVIGVWLLCIGIYHLATNVSSLTPPDEIPKWWVPGIAAVSVASLGGALGLVVFASL